MDRFPILQPQAIGLYRNLYAICKWSNHIDVAAGKFTDAAGNNSSASNQFNWTFKDVYAVKKDGTGDFTTIQAAADAVSTGDSIFIYNGTYSKILI